ncbi:hypothetical protein FDP41_006206 [Naegleria fowleri]|uniref:DUF4476 domain-containing protein n=1 Tax=Naegleria fowleri TaxID=5763 RepID=A0A6A5BIP7_NAEFO|nr:uncharacterized protein FDP41_006206 [Naegleria fowleri]KAF0974732.1 hypothetical protein FDP41_006206 [Naegleria fowleri]CAG4717336.1 unnamed protein product [Naegleria fowleri]
MGNTSPIVAGSWREKSGKIWHCTQNGNQFSWTQEGTGRQAHGTIVAVSMAPASFSIHITFDGNVHWKLTPSLDGTALTGKSDTFYRVNTGVALAPATIHNLSGIPSQTLNSSPSHTLKAMHVNLMGVTFRENSGKTWHVDSQPHTGYIVMKNQQDGRRAYAYIVRDVSQNKYIIFIDFDGAETSFRVDTFDINTWPLQNGDCFRAITSIVQPASSTVVTTTTTTTPLFNVSIGSTGISVGVPTQTTTTFVPPPTTTTYIPPTTTYIPPPTTSYVPPQQSYVPPQQHTYVPPPQPFCGVGTSTTFTPQVMTTSIYPNVTVSTTTSSAYGVSMNPLVNSIVQACQNHTFDTDKFKTVITYTQSQVSPVIGADIIKIIALFNFDSDKYKVIQQLRTTNNIAGLDCNTAASILRCFAHDSDKVKVVHELCPFIWDRRQNAEIIVGCFTFSSDQTKIRDYLFRN